MKKYTLIALVALTSQLSLIEAASKEKDALEDAIELSDIAAAKKALKRLSPLSAKDQKEFLHKAEDVLDEHEAQVGIFKSGKDFSKLLFGSVLGAGMLGFVWMAGLKTRMSGLDSHGPGGRRTKIKWMRVIPALAASAAGFYIAGKGARCTTAKARVLAARAVLNEIKRTEIEDADSKLTECVKA